MNLTAAMFWSERDFGLVISTNIASTAADDALRKLAAELYKGFFEGGDVEANRLYFVRPDA
jgi:hypothetical protein